MPAVIPAYSMCSPDVSATWVGKGDMAAVRRLAHICVDGVVAAACVGLLISVPSGGYVRDARTVAASLAALNAEDTASYDKTQQVYAWLTHRNQGAWIVRNVFSVNSPGTIVDYGAASGGAAIATEESRRIEALRPGELSTQTVVRPGGKELPWTIDVRYSLDGPDASERSIVGADGLVGVHVSVAPNPVADSRYGHDAMPLVAFTVPKDAASSVAVPGGRALVTDDGDRYLVTALGAAGQSNTWDCYVTATAFRMGKLIVAAVPADRQSDGREVDAAALRDRFLSLAVGAGQLTASAADGTENGDADANAERYASLLDELASKRDEERAAAAQDIETTHAAYARQFGVYIDRYVHSYAAHMTMPAGRRTQMGALIGMTGELTGDTPLAASVTDLANAVNDMSAAHEHEGAADVLDTVLDAIRRNGLSGLAANLKDRQIKELSVGKTRYADGQSQLANAMISFSMAYTDAFTGYIDQGSDVVAAVGQTNAAFGDGAAAGRYTSGISTALSTMANASRHTGMANMLGEAIERIEAAEQSGHGDQTVREGAGGDSRGDDSATNGRSARQDGIAAMPISGAVQPQDETRSLSEGSGDSSTQIASLRDCGSDLQAAANALLPAGAQPSDIVREALAASAARVDGVADSAAGAVGDVVSPDNRHTRAASFLIALPEVGDADAIAVQQGSAHAAESQIPGLGAIVGKFMG